MDNNEAIRRLDQVEQQRARQMREQEEGPWKDVGKATTSGRKMVKESPVSGRSGRSGSESENCRECFGSGPKEKPRISQRKAENIPKRSREYAKEKPTVAVPRRLQHQRPLKISHLSFPPNKPNRRPWPTNIQRPLRVPHYSPRSNHALARLRPGWL
jgi:hypothetical protein